MWETIQQAKPPKDSWEIGKIHTMAQDSNIDEDKSDNESEGDSLDVTKKSFKCRLCKMEFPSTSSLKVH